MTPPADPPPASLHLTRTVLARVQLALRQYVRVNTTLTAAWRLREEMGFTEGVVPREIVDADVDTEDAGYFLIVALRSAARGQRVLQRAGVELPTIRGWEQLKALRDLHEHWDGWATEPYGISDEPWRRSKAGQEWSKFSDTRPEGGWGWTAAPDGTCRMGYFRGLELDPIVKDLEALKDAVADLERRAFEYEHLTVEEAAELVGGGRLTAIFWFTSLRAHPARDGVHRLDREQLLRSLKMVNDNLPGARFSEDHSGDVDD